MYAMFGFLLINLHLVAVITGLLSIIQTYAVISAGDWRWWWRSFYLGLAAGLFMGFYSLYFMVFEL